MRLKLNSYNVFLTFRRAVGIIGLILLIYFLGILGIKTICYLMYAGTEIIDGFFKILINLF